MFNNKEKAIEAQKEIVRYKDAQISIQKAKKWTWGLIGVVLGSFISLLVF